MVKNFDHDHGQNSAFNHGQMVKISTMTTAKIQIFHGQNGQPKILQRNSTTKLNILTMTMAKKQISYGQNGKPLI